MVEKRLGCKWSGFEMVSKILKPNHLKSNWASGFQIPFKIQTGPDFRSPLYRDDLNTSIHLSEGKEYSYNLTEQSEYLKQTEQSEYQKQTNQNHDSIHSLISPKKRRGSRPDSNPPPGQDLIDFIDRSANEALDLELLYVSD